jgi:hypothetical protein
MSLTFITVLSIVLGTATGCVQCKLYYCPNACGWFDYCSGGDAPLNSPCCLPNRSPISSSQIIEKASCASTGQQLFNYSASTGQFSITTKTGSRMCLEVYWGDYCNKQPTPLLFVQCDPSRTNQQWMQSWDSSSQQIFSKGHTDPGGLTYCMSSALSLYGSQASAELAYGSDSLQQWSFNWTSGSGNLRNAATGSCLQMPASLYGTSMPAVDVRRKARIN